MSEVNNIPTDNFDLFMQLEDTNINALSADTKQKLQADHAEYKSQQEEVIVDDYDEPDEVEQYETPDWSFLEEDGNASVLFEDDAPEEPEQEEEGEENPFEDEEPSTEESDDTDYGDTVDIDLDTIITVHGKEYTAEELVNRYQEDEYFNQQKAAFEAEREAFIADKEASVSLLELSNLECTRQIAEYDNFDWDWYATNDPQAYVENKRYLERIQHKKAEIMEQQKQLQAEKQYQEDQAFRAKSRKCVEILQHEIKDWSENKYNALMDHAINYYGCDPAIVERWNEPSIFIMLNDAYRAHNDILKAKASIKRTKVNGRFLRPGSSASKANAKSKQEAAARAYASGKLSQEAAFSFLED